MGWVVRFDCVVVLMGTVIQFRLPGNEDRRRPQIVIDSRRSLVHPSYQIKVPVLRHPTVYDWDLEQDE